MGSRPLAPHTVLDLHTWAVRSHQLLPPGFVARNNRCDSKVSARSAPPSRKPRTGLAHGNLSGSPPRAVDSTDSEIKVQEARNVLRISSPGAKDQDVGETHSKGPGCITSMRWGRVLLPQVCTCTPSKTHTGEEVTGVQVGPTLQPVRKHSEDWLSGLESRAGLRITVVPLAL